MTILLDIDGVLVTTPAWRTAELETDGFLRFNDKAVKNLARILTETNATIVLTTTHRVNYSIEEWEAIFKIRGIFPFSVSKVNDIKAVSDMADRATEIKEWVEKQTVSQPFVIIDDDPSINDLPSTIKEKCVLTKSMIGLDEESTIKTLDILRNRFSK
jgi:hypothetical protein